MSRNDLARLYPILSTHWPNFTPPELNSARCPILVRHCSGIEEPSRRFAEFESDGVKRPGGDQPLPALLREAS